MWRAGARAEELRSSQLPASQVEIPQSSRELELELEVETGRSLAATAAPARARLCPRTAADCARAPAARAPTARPRALPCARGTVQTRSKKNALGGGAAGRTRSLLSSMCGSNPEVAPEVNKAKCFAGCAIGFFIFPFGSGISSFGSGVFAFGMDECEKTVCGDRTTQRVNDLKICFTELFVDSRLQQCLCGFFCRLAQSSFNLRL